MANTSAFSWKKLGGVVAHQGMFLLNAMQGIGYYRKLRTEGRGVLPSLARTMWDFGVMGHPLMMSIQIGGAVAGAWNGAAQKRAYRMRSRTQNFTSPQVDTEEIAQSRGQLMQSAVASNSALRLSGRSFAGSEASILHRRYTS